MDHRFVRQPFGEPGVPLGGANIVDPRFHEQEGRDPGKRKTRSRGNHEGLCCSPQAHGASTRRVRFRYDAADLLSASRARAAMRTIEALDDAEALVHRIEEDPVAVELRTKRSGRVFRISQSISHPTVVTGVLPLLERI